jgi:hypothetical protein
MAVKTTVLILYVVALLMQLGGALGIISDVRRSVANFRQFMNDWEQAMKIGWPEPAQEALAKYAQAQNSISRVRRWAPVVVLLVGVLAAFLGNALSLTLSSVPPNERTHGGSAMRCVDGTHR